MAQAGENEPRLETELRTVDPKEVELLEINARFMSSETYQRLVRNIQHDGELTSVPLCYQTPDGKLRCISGNHRTKAAVDAGLASITVQVITTPITNDKFIALQLSHNALVGQDNQETLRLLWHKIDDADMKVYSGLDKGIIQKLDEPTIPPIDARLDFEQVTVLFVGSEKEEVANVAKEARQRGILNGEVWAKQIEAYETVSRVLGAVCEAEGVHNFATALLCMARYAEKFMASQVAGEGSDLRSDAGEVTPETRSATS